VEINRKRQEAIAAGRDVIDFGVGDPDLPTPAFIVERMAESVRHPPHHRYPQGIGSPAFRAAVAKYFQHRFDVALDVQTEVLALIGSKEGLGHFPTAIVDPGDVVLIPQPGYPVYEGGTVFAGGRCEPLPLREKNAWLPVFSEIPAESRRKAKLMFLNYPNNPTGACAPRSFFREAVAFAREYYILIAHDAAYCDQYFDEPPSSILEVEGAKDVCVEFHSLSKTFNMTGWRIGFAVGNAGALAALAAVKNNIDSGVFTAVQEAGIAALEGIHRKEIQEQTEVYRRRRDVLVRGLQKAGWMIHAPQATFYVWVRCPGARDSARTSARLLDEADVVVIPGAGFGPHGEGYVRFALTVSEERTQAAVQRIAGLKW